MDLLPALKDRIVASDPGLTRLLMGARATLAVGAALGILLLVAHTFRLPVTVPLVGAALGMTWSLSANDPKPRDQRITTLLLWLPAAAALTIGTETAPYRVLGDALFVIVLFVSMYLRKYGPRGYSVGMISVLAFFFALFLRAAPDQLPWMLLALAVTAFCTYAARFFIFRDRPRFAFANAVAAFRARQRLAERAIAQAAERGCWTNRLKRRLEHHIFRLNENALAIDDMLREPEDVQIRVQVLEAELATSECAERARTAAKPEACDIEPLSIPSMPDLGASNWVPRAAFRVGTKLQMRVEPTTRQAIQLTVAAIPAIVIGEMLSAQRWYWAVLAAFVVFGGTSSSGETLYKAWGRVLGTALGVAGGIVLAYLVRGHGDLAFVLLMCCLFLAVYTFRLSYAVMIFFITMLLALLYVIMGLFSDQLLVLRLIETAIGAALGGIAATLLFPIRTRSVLYNVTREALSRLRDTIDACIARIAGDANADPLGAARNYDEAFQSVRTLLQPLIGATRLGNTDRLRTRLLVMSACGYYVRALASLAYESPTNCDLETLRKERDAIDTEIAAITAASAGESLSLAHTGDRAPPADGAALTYLYRIDRALHRLAQTIETDPR